MLYNYRFSNAKRDLTDILSTVIKDEPRFISNFKRVAGAFSRKHEWLEDSIDCRAVTATKIDGGWLFFASPTPPNVKSGTLLQFAGHSALFVVRQVGEISASIDLAASNGSTSRTESLPAAGGVFKIVSTPMEKATVNGGGDEHYTLSDVNYNCTQIFRKEIILPGNSMAVSLYGSLDNQLNRQTAISLADFARDLNRVALFGRRVEAKEDVRGECGGLYAFATDSGALEIDASSAVLDSCLVNDAAQKIINAGGEPQQILCSPGQARVLSFEYRDRLQVLRSDDRRGAYVAVIVNEINGRGFTVMADPDVPDNDTWIIDPSGFGIAHLIDTTFADVDTTPRGFDGIRRTAWGELTFEFKNARQRCCRIRNLQSSSSVIGQLRKCE